MACLPAFPCCLPVDACPAPLPQGQPMCYTSQELDALTQCDGPSKRTTPRNILVQQPPRLVTKKRTIAVDKVVNIPQIHNRLECYLYPKITQCSKVVKIPVIRYYNEVYKEPKVTWFQSYKADPFVIAVPRVIIQPKEICQTLLCQPKTQVVDVPVPKEYCVYPAGPENLRYATPCPPYPSPPSSGFQPCFPFGSSGGLRLCRPCASGLPSDSCSYRPHVSFAARGPCGPRMPYCPTKPIGPPENPPESQCPVPCRKLC